MSHAVHRRKRSRQGDYSMSLITPTPCLAIDFASLTLKRNSEELKELREKMSSIRDLLISLEGSIKRIESVLGITQEKREPIPEECYYYA